MGERPLPEVPVKATDRFFVKGVSCLLEGQRLPVANLSVGGLFAATSRPPLKGQVVSLEIVIDGRAAFRIVGKVTWINPPERPQSQELPQGFGIKITQIALADKLAILDLLKRSGRQAIRGRRTQAPPS